MLLEQLVICILNTWLKFSSVVLKKITQCVVTQEYLSENRVVN